MRERQCKTVTFYEVRVLLALQPLFPCCIGGRREEKITGNHGKRGAGGLGMQTTRDPDDGL